MTESDEDPIVGAGGANKAPVRDEGETDSPLPNPRMDEDGKPVVDDRSAPDAE